MVAFLGRTVRFREGSSPFGLQSCFSGKSVYLLDLFPRNRGTFPTKQ